MGADSCHTCCEKTDIVLQFIIERNGDMESYGLILVGILVLICGIIMFSGRIEIVHSYNRKRITEESRKPYGRCVGAGSIIIGAGIIIDGIITFFSKNIPHVITMICAFVGVVFIFYGQFKYNKGIF